ncbi:hypothetical protein VTN00DRAFT_2971 [Thermoascus crustaceus]|uniref:uncharacterized protein n=1 Tax=Thermoascus crustaceus TaxID=5088 RepID=UPI0037429BFB
MALREMRGQTRQLSGRQQRPSGEGLRAYRAQPGWKQDPVAAAAPKKIASRYYQLKTGHEAIGTYLQKIQVRDSEACQGCQAPKESVYHLLFECREWQKQRRALYRALTRARVALPTTTEGHPEGRLLGDPKATKAILQFLADTTVGCPLGETARAAERIQKDDEWGLAALEEAEQIHSTSGQRAFTPDISFNAPLPSSNSPSRTNRSSPSVGSTSSMPLTCNNLAEQDRHSTLLWNGPNASRQMQKEKETQLKAALESLGCDMSNNLIGKVADNCEGMLPMERYLAGKTCSRDSKEKAGELHRR